VDAGCWASCANTGTERADASANVANREERGMESEERVFMMGFSPLLLFGADVYKRQGLFRSLRVPSVDVRNFPVLNTPDMK